MKVQQFLEHAYQAAIAIPEVFLAHVSKEESPKPLLPESRRPSLAVEDAFAGLPKVTRRLSLAGSDAMISLFNQAGKSKADVIHTYHSKLADLPKHLFLFGSQLVYEVGVALQIPDLFVPKELDYLPDDIDKIKNFPLSVELLNRTEGKF